MRFAVPWFYFCFIVIFFLLGMALAGCSLVVTPGIDPVETKISSLQTEQALLRTQLALLEPAATTTSTPTLQPTGTPPPPINPTKTTAPLSLLPEPLYFLGQDAAAREQVFRLETDGVTLTQITFEQRRILEYDISPSGDLAYVVEDKTDNTVQLILLAPDAESASVIEMRTSELEKIKNLRWLPNGEELVYHRTIQLNPPATDENQPTPSSPLLARELVVYNRLTQLTTVLLRAGDDTLAPVIATLYTDESLEYDAGHDWETVYRVTAVSPEARFLLIQDSGGSFWMIYDLRTRSLILARILAASADFSPNEQIICLTSDFSRADFHPSQALLCGNFLTSSLEVYLNAPDWQPQAINLWEAENALVFLQFVPTETNGRLLQLYGMDLTDREPVLLRQEEWLSDETTLEVLHAPTENPAQGMVVATGQAQGMETPGLVILPTDPRRNTLYLPQPSAVRLLRWGTEIIP